MFIHGWATWMNYLAKHSYAKQLVQIGPPYIIRIRYSFSTTPMVYNSKIVILQLSTAATLDNNNLLLTASSIQTYVYQITLIKTFVSFKIILICTRLKTNLISFKC